MYAVLENVPNNINEWSDVVFICVINFIPVTYNNDDDVEGGIILDYIYSWTLMRLWNATLKPEAPSDPKRHISTKVLTALKGESGSPEHATFTHKSNCRFFYDKRGKAYCIMLNNENISVS